MAQRRKRRTKAEIEADKAAKAAKAAEEAEMKEAGYEKTRARDSEGHFIKDDPSTPENEAWEWKKKEEETPAPKVEAAEEAPAKRVKPADHKPKPKPKAAPPMEPTGWAARFRARKAARGQ